MSQRTHALPYNLTQSMWTHLQQRHLRIQLDQSLCGLVSGTILGSEYNDGSILLRPILPTVLLYVGEYNCKTVHPRLP